MIETKLLGIFQNALSVPVYMEEPENAPRGGYVVLRKTGSACENRIREATIAVLSYGDSLEKAAELNETVVLTALELGPADGVFSCKLNSDYEYTDLQTKQYRYQAVLEVYY